MMTMLFLSNVSSAGVKIGFFVAGNVGIFITDQLLYCFYFSNEKLQ